MNLLEKQSLTAKYLLRGFSSEMQLRTLCEFCLEEAKSRVFGSGNEMVIDKAAKLATQMIARLPMTEICLFLRRNKMSHLRKALSLSTQKNIFKKSLVKAIRHSMGNIMNILVNNNES